MIDGNEVLTNIFKSCTKSKNVCVEMIGQLP
ncbi:hypothetical protein STA3757_37040 [Stanieria sp. NIES-3757]|nr:hypothetical protein STA3757_37040 [Stanieria sp. NIES-3757]